MSYIVTDETDNAFKVQHPDGAVFTVAKKGLSAKTLEKMQALKPKQMAEGGIVTQEDLPPILPMPSPVSNPYMSPADAFVSSVQPELVTQAPMTPMIAAAPVPQVPVEVTPAPVAAPVAQAVATAQKLNPLGLTGDLKTITDTQMKGLQQEASALSERYKAEEKLQQDFADQQIKQQEIFKQKEAALDMELKDIYEKTKGGQIDPNRFWNNQSSGNRIMASVAVALGAMGAAITGGKNDALDIIQAQVNRDIEAQKAELGQRNNLLSFNLNRLGNLQAAEQATRLQQMSVLQAQLQSAAAKSGNKLAQAQLNKQMADYFVTRVAPMKSQLAQQQAFAQIAGGGAGDNAFALLGKDDQARAVKMPDGSYKLAQSADDAKQIKEVVTSLDSLEQDVDDALSFAKGAGASANIGAFGFGTDAYEQSKALQTRIINGIGALKDMTKLPAGMAKKIENLVPRPGSTNIPLLGDKEGSTKLLLDLKKLIAEKRNSEYSTKLLGVPRVNFKKRE